MMNENTEGCRAGEVLDAEEPGEAAGGVSNDEGLIKIMQKTMWWVMGRKAPVHCSQKLKSQKVNKGDACEQRKHNTYVH